MAFTVPESPGQHLRLLQRKTGHFQNRPKEDSMKINSLMITDPITITENASIQEAIELMKINSIRHLPVVAK